MTRPPAIAEFARSELEVDSCWKRIGIEGDRSCPELPRHSHCRNCPAFSRAAAALLDRDPYAEPAANNNGTTGKFGSVEASLDAETRSESITVFRVGGEWFGLPTRAIDEIVGLPPIHSLPHRRNSGVLGLANIRGELVICLSPAEFLTVAAESASPQGRLIVVRHLGGRLALLVDEVLQVHHYSRGELQPLPATVARSASSFTRALLPYAGKVIGVLDEQALFEALQRTLT